jgi:hypothetical protein
MSPDISEWLSLLELSCFLGSGPIIPEPWWTYYAITTRQSSLMNITSARPAKVRICIKLLRHWNELKNECERLRFGAAMTQWRFPTRHDMQCCWMTKIPIITGYPTLSKNGRFSISFHVSKISANFINKKFDFGDRWSAAPWKLCATIVEWREKTVATGKTGHQTELVKPIATWTLFGLSANPDDHRLWWWCR